MFGWRLRGGPVRVALALGVVVAGAGAGAAQASARPSIHADHGCYVVGQAVHLSGKGFAASRPFDLAVDGVDFGQTRTTGFGTFAVKVGLGGLNGVAQHVELLSATDGSSEADTRVTLMAKAGARILASRGNVTTLRAPVEVWGFSPDGPPRSVYLHYVAPTGRLVRTDGLGRTGGQCGYLRTTSRRVFPFSPATGAWTLQIDTQRRYAPRPSGPAQRIRVTVG
jgi:hypothetical protein